MFAGNSFLVKERVGVFKLTDCYDVYDAATGEKLAEAREEPPTWATWLRLVISKQFLPTAVNVYDFGGNSPLMSISRSFTFLRNKVLVRTGAGEHIGYFKSKVLSMGGGFWIHDMSDTKVGEVKGDWKGWNFKILGPTGGEIGAVTKKWAGIGKELLTSADNYVIALKDGATHSDKLKMLLLAAGLAIDVVFKERG